MWPGALPGSAVEADAATIQQVAAALAIVTSGARRTKAAVPDFSAVNTSLRLAVRSSALAAPKGSITTAPIPIAPKISAPARRAESVSGAQTNMIRSGFTPSSATPGP